MAKKSMINRNEKRRKMAANQLERRDEWREKSLDESLSWEERMEFRRKLQSLPRNGSQTRVVSRCLVTGRGRGVYRKFGLSRIKFREFALDAKIPGVTKASW